MLHESLYSEYVLKVATFLKVAAENVDSISREEFDLAEECLDDIADQEPEDKYLVLQGGAVLVSLLPKPVDNADGPRGSRTINGIEFRADQMHGETTCK